LGIGQNRSKFHRQKHRRLASKKSSNRYTRHDDALISSTAPIKKQLMHITGK